MYMAEQCKCYMCGADLDPIDVRKHIMFEHGIPWKNYYQMAILEKLDKNTSCWNCGSRRALLSPIFHDEFILPCPKCGTSDEILEVINKFLEKAVTDKYYQEILSTPEWIQSTLKYSIKILKQLLKGDRKDYSKKSRISIDFQPWAPHEISVRNLEGLLITRYDDVPKSTVSEDSGFTYYEFILPGYGPVRIKYPEITPFDFRHHSRYSIFNQKDCTRKTKKLKFSGTNDCIKFFNPKIFEFRSILQLERPDGVKVDFEGLTDFQKKMVKLQIFRTRPLLEMVVKTFRELCHYSCEIWDSVLTWNHSRLYAKMLHTVILLGRRLQNHGKMII